MDALIVSEKGGEAASRLPTEFADESVRPTEFESWEAEYRRLRRLFEQTGTARLADLLEELIQLHPTATEAYLVAGRILSELGHHDTACTLFEQATRFAIPGTLRPNHPYTAAHLGALLGATNRHDVDDAALSRSLESNLAAYRECDPVGAAEVAGASDPPSLRVIDIWGKPMFVDPKTRVIAVPSESFVAATDGCIAKGHSLAMFGVGSGQEVLDLLDRTPVGFMESFRGHYLFEAEAAKLRLFFKLRDISDFIARRRLLIFGGTKWRDSMRRAFATRRCPHPAILGGNHTAYMIGYESVINESRATDDEKLRVAEYYASEEYRGRLEAIAKGEIPPRVLLLTCRWTTVLKHVCATFQDGFQRHGCETEYLIEGTDSEVLSRDAYLAALDTFKPDVAFSVSHARPSYHFLPRELPIVGFIMDNCGPILERARLDSAIAPHDLFVCINGQFKRFLMDKGVPERQIEVVVTPSDPLVYRPLDPADPLVRELDADVSWMKHAGAGDAEQCMQALAASQFRNLADPKQRFLKTTVENVHRHIMTDRARQWFDADILALANSLLDPGAPAEWLEDLRGLLIKYKIGVIGASYRQQFLEALEPSGLKLCLYGNGWDKHPLFARFARGQLEPGERLNAAYNGSRINLHIHNEMSMHQRLVEGALAGGFFLVNRLDPERDYEPVESYFEPDREIVYFETGEELREKCRYYLEHEDERIEIAARMRQRALSSYTVEKISESVLDLIRSRIQKVEVRGSSFRRDSLFQ